MDTETVIAYVSLGSNLGDRAGNLLLGVRGLMEAVEIESSTNFLNMVAELKCESITPSQMMARMLRIEYLLGRKDKSLKKPRTIDLDLLFYNHEQTETEFLTLPHPRLHLRNFVLVPMSEIAPTFVHPIFQKDIKTLLSETPDMSAVTRWN